MKDSSMESVRLDGKTVVITGANCGIGKSTAVGLARRGAQMILACCSERKAEEARTDIVAETGNENVEVRTLDLPSLQSVRDFAEKFNTEESRLDILVCNAGVITQKRSVTKDGVEQMFAVNHLGHFLLTNLLLKKLKSCAPSRVVVVSSLAHWKHPVAFTDLQSEQDFDYLTVYGRSKSCNILFAVHLAKLLEGSGVTTYSLHPGLIPSGFGRDLTILKLCNKRCICSLFACWYGMPVYTVDEGARTTLYCCLEPSIAEGTGKFFRDCDETTANQHAMDEKSAEKLWSVSAELCGLI